MFLIFFLAIVSWASTPEGCTGTENTLPVVTTAPVLKKTVTNGKLFTVPVDGNGPDLNVVHLYGTAYEMGVAQGQLVGDQIREFYAEVPLWIDGQIDQYLHELPAVLRTAIEELGVWAALELEVLATEEYTPQRYLDEMRGLGDSTGVDYMHIRRISLLPELIKAACSMSGAWGSAVKAGNSLLQLRALDWSTNGPFQKFPALQVYHPQRGDGQAFATIGWLGFVGSITGFSSAPLGVCEKVWLSYNGSDSRFGTPFHFVLRDILQYDQTVDAALTRIADADRTCSIWVGLGHPTEHFTAVGYSLDDLRIWDHATFPSWEGHPRFNDLLYIDKHKQPSHNPCMANILKQRVPLQASDYFRYVTAQLQTGDTHAAVYDFAHNVIYVSNASPYINGHAIPAYDRPFVQLNMTVLFNM